MGYYDRMTTHIESPFVSATYLLEDQANKLEKRAEGIAVGLTVGSWTDLPAAKQQERIRHRGRVERIDVIAEGRRAGTVQATLTIGYPTANLVPQIPALLTTIFGKLSMDGQIRLIDIQLPDAFVRQFPGPKYGVDGIRSRCNVHHRPLLMSIFKSCIGLSLDELGDHFREQALGGVDFIKDDEIFFSEEYGTPEERVVRFRRIAEEVGALTDKTLTYAVNLTGQTSGLVERARRLADLGAGALLLNVLPYGFDVLQELAADPDIPIPILVHPALAGALYGAPTTGIGADILLGQLTRLAGADIVIYPSPYGSVTLPLTEGRRLMAALRVDNGLRRCLPAPSAGIHPGMVPTLVQDAGIDLMVNAGGGIHGHPGGATAGGRAFVAAIEAAVQGTPLTEAATTSPELAQALDIWGTL